ncbi:hypothetical protein HWV62_19199 [Athelia sp. TMB]|nr:hypothetical protein HWV62_19199 [Athelia sp. TMB]
MPNQKTLSIDFSDESTVFVEREPTAIEIAQGQEIRQLKALICKMRSRNRDIDETSKFWKAEAAKHEEYVALGKRASDRLHGEIDNLKARIRNLYEMNKLLKMELSKEEFCTILSRHEINRLRDESALLDSTK